MSSPKKFYITTAIAYTNAPPHIGFALELAQADAIARWRGLRGEKRFFLTGTDEHGRKNAQAAEAAGKDPKTFVDEMSSKYQELAKALNISNDDFIRTSDQKRHWPGVIKFWKELHAAGDLYKGKYKGLYCIGCEAFKKPSDLSLHAGKLWCPDHHKEPDEVEEENWFFRLSKYEKELLQIVGRDLLRIIPETRKNEVLAFIAQGLEDVSFSRPSKDLSWGIPVPGDNTQTMYVWADALVNYLTGIGYGQDTRPTSPASELVGGRARNKTQDTKFQEFWPADLHVVGKDILRFHAVIWPAMLLSVNLPLPKALLVHGHILSEGQKMSKTLSNAVDPFVAIEKYGADVARYFLLKEIPTTDDGDITEQRFKDVYEAELANSFGNLLSRVAKLATGEEIMPKAGEEVREVVKRAWEDYEAAFGKYALHEATNHTLALANFANEFIERTKPWESKEGREGALPQLIYILGNIAWMLAPFLPETSRKMFDQLGLDSNSTDLWEQKAVKVRKGEALFPRL